MMRSEEYYQDISKFSLGIRCYDADNHWVEAPRDLTFAGPKKTILILPGSGVNRAKEANGMCKIVEKMIPIEYLKEYQICSLYYDNSYTLSRPTIIRAEKIFDQYILPLIASKDANGNLHRLNAQQAAHNLRNLTVVTHCYGGFIMQAIDKLLKQTMDDLRYMGGEQRYIHRQLFVVQHNNIDEDLGRVDFGSTNLIRISAADEKTWCGDMLEDSFRFYAETNRIQEKDLLYLSISDNTRALWTKRITKDGQREHNGGYWINPIYKTKAGKIEELLFQTIFTEAITSNKMIDSMEQIIRDAVQKNPGQQTIFQEVICKGKDFSVKFEQYSRRIRRGFATLKDKIFAGDTSTVNMEQLPLSVIFAEDADGKFLLDHALAQCDYEFAEKLAHYMAPHIPTDTCLSKCRNQTDADHHREKWAQQAIDAHQPELLCAIRGMSQKVLRLNYEKADARTLFAAAQIYSSYDFPKTLSAQEEYCKYLADLYAKSIQFKNNEYTDKTQQTIEDILFHKHGEEFKISAYARNKMRNFCQLNGADQLLMQIDVHWGAWEDVKKQYETDKMR